MQRITTMLLCEVAAMAFYVVSLWFEQRGQVGAQIVCTFLGAKYVLYGVSVLFKTPTEARDDA